MSLMFIDWSDLQELREHRRELEKARPWSAEGDREDLVDLVDELALMVVEVTGVAIEAGGGSALPGNQQELIDIALQAALKRVNDRIRKSHEIAFDIVSQDAPRTHENETRGV